MNKLIPNYKDLINFEDKHKIDKFQRIFKEFAQRLT